MSTVLPDKQSAWIVVRSGAPRKALEFRTDWPVPKPENLEEGEILVRIQAGALNPAGWKGMLAPNFLMKRPHVAEFDFAGIVIDGNGTGFAAGDPVYGWIHAGVQRHTKQGALAEYAKATVSSGVAKRPANITPVEAAGVTLVALTSYQALFRIAKLEADQTVFINGGSSALGIYAIQMAKAKGVRVVTTASGRNEQFVRSLGADEFIDYTKMPLHEYLIQNPPATKYHAIYDAVGLIDPSLFTYSEKYLAPNGVFITSGPMPKSISASEMWKLAKTLAAMFWPAWLGGTPRKYVLFFTNCDPDDMEEIRKLLESGKVKPIVDSTYEMKDIGEAYDRMKSGRATGKIVVKVDPTVD